MTLDEALHEAVSGARMTAPHFDGVYIEHSFSRGFLRCWPVDKPEDEPNRSQCAFDPKPEDRAATDWFEIEAPVYSVDHSEEDKSIMVGFSNPSDGWAKKRFVFGDSASGGKTKAVRDMQAEALALMGATVNIDSLPPGVYSATFEEIKMTEKGHVITKIGNVKPVVPDKWGVAIPGAKPVLDVDAPKRDSWGRIIP